MADKLVGPGWALRRLEMAVELARKVGRPLTFFAAIGFALILFLPVVLWQTSDDTVPAIMAGMIGVDIICVLIWALYKLKKDPKAFQDE